MPKFKEKTKIIEVKPVDADDTDHIITYDESNVSASPDTTGITLYKASSLGDTMKDSASGAESEAEFTKINEYKIKHVQTLMTLNKNYEQMKRQMVDEVTKTTEGTSNVDGEDVGGDTANGENEKKRKKKSKRKKKRTKDKTKAVETTEAKSNEASDQKTNDDPKIEVVETEPNDAQEKNKRKLPCIFGFVATWLAKRKERRREKKRKAIEARSQNAVESLVEYEHKLAKGGVAFTVEVDSRPMRKPVLPPIKPRPGPIVNGTDEKLRLAELKRSEVLEKKKQSAKDNERKIAECHEKKAESEFYFKQKATLTIRYKQYDAERKRARLLEDRRCSTPLLRAPSTLPPLRNVRVKPVNQTGSRATDARDGDPVDGVFSF